MDYLFYLMGGFGRICHVSYLRQRRGGQMQLPPRSPVSPVNIPFDILTADRLLNETCPVYRNVYLGGL